LYFSWVQPFGTLNFSKCSALTFTNLLIKVKTENWELLKVDKNIFGALIFAVRSNVTKNEHQLGSFGSFGSFGSHDRLSL